jgi:hypothetical protein
MRTPVCSECKSPLVRGTVLLRGRYSNVEIVIEGLPILHCVAHGNRRFFQRDFGSDVLQGVWAILQPAARRPIRIMKPRCFRDGTPLRVDSPLETTWYSGILSLRDGSSPVAKVQAPSLTCPSCGAVQLATSPALDSDVADALLDAFKSAQVSRWHVPIGPDPRSGALFVFVPHGGGSAHSVGEALIIVSGS